MSGENNGHIWTGAFLLLIGGIALAKSFGADLPEWLFTWQMLLIGIGFFIGFRHGFRSGGWFVPILVGGAFLANEYFLDGQLRKHIWPIILITIGLAFILRPRRMSCKERWKAKKSGDIPVNSGPPDGDWSYSQDDFLNTTAIFGGSKKIILSKDFKGGDIVTVFGGSEINLAQADITKEAIIEVTTIFGGATMVVPSNWSVKSEAVTIFGGIQDKRSMPSVSEGPTKVLVIKGTVIFGGIEIKNF
jgi:predicted membrane protein